LEAVKAAPAAAPVAEAKPVEPAAPEKPKEPDRNVNYQEWLEWKIAQQDNTQAEQAKIVNEYKTFMANEQNAKETQAAINRGVEEFQGIEQSYIKQNPDYLKAMEFAREKYSDALRLTNPQFTAKQIDAKIDYDILSFAAQASVKGLNPAEELYDMAMERFGYSKAEERAEQSAVRAERREKPNLKVITNNKRRSATPLSGGGRGGDIPLTLDVAANSMTLGEFANLTPGELAQLEESY
jgi:hypothetical protein